MTQRTNFDFDNNPDASAALTWIVGIFQTQNIPFQIMGGLAAQCYGSHRPLFDIDADISEKDFDRLVPFVQNYLIFGPERYLNEMFDLLMMTVKFHGMLIDISGRDSGKLRNAGTGLWEKIDIDLHNSNWVTMYGVTFPIVTKEDLIAYKKKMRRPEDVADVAVLQ